MIISNKKYQAMYDRIKVLERQNRDLKHQNESLKEENYQLIKSAMSSPFGTVAWKDMNGNIHTTKTQIELDFPNSSKEPMSSGDKIY